MTPRVLLDIVLRTAVLIAVEFVFLKIVDLPGDDDGLGTGLLAFATIFVVSGGWGLVDGLRHEFGRLAIGWIVTGILAALALILLGSGTEGLGTAALVNDIRESTPFLAGLVIVPALLGGALSAIIRRVTTSPPAEHPAPVDSTS